jgi:hypothetical protein
MNRNVVIWVVAIFLIAIAGMFVYAYIARNAIDEPLEPQTPAQTDPTAYDHITRIDAKHFFIDGVHTIAGEVILPTPCDLLEADATVAESMPEQVTVNFNVINNAETCAQVETPQRFAVEFQASEEADIRARFMGRDIELNLVDPLPGETPDDFELFIKG